MLVFRYIPSTYDISLDQKWGALLIILVNFKVSFPICWCHFGSGSVIWIILIKSLMNVGRLKSGDTHHALFCGMIPNATSITHNCILYALELWNKSSSRFFVHTNVMKEHWQGIIKIPIRVACNCWMCLILWWYFITIDICNYWTLGVMWKWLHRWIQSGSIIAVFKLSCNVHYFIRFVDLVFTS